MTTSENTVLFEVTLEASGEVTNAPQPEAPDADTEEAQE